VIKSPLNYVGGKYKLLSQILPLFPKEIDTFYDLFGGGFNVGINVDAKKHVYNDILKPVVELLWALKKEDRERVLMFIDDYIDQYNLSKTNKEGYLALRERYNETKRSPFMFYTLVAHSFNNQIRFNKKGEFNMPFGMNRSSFNPTLRKRFVEFVDKLHTLDVEFYSKDFREFYAHDFKTNDFIYIDTPYLGTVATYNENGGWTEKDERDVHEFLDRLNKKGIKFALSNVFESKGQSNDILKDWAKQYNVHYLDISYSNCNHQRKSKAPDVEVLVTNY
jgi:DNA adenine methylase Dam